MIGATAQFHGSFSVKRIRCFVRGHDYGHVFCPEITMEGECRLDVRHLHSVSCARCHSHWIWWVPDERGSGFIGRRPATPEDFPL